MSPESQNRAALEQDDTRELYTLVRDHSVDIASLKSGLDSLSRSTESGFSNLANQIDGIGVSLRSTRPQLGVVATILFSATALIGALAGFALKSSITPIEHDIANHVQVRDLLFSFNDERLKDIERRMQVRFSDADDAQNERIKSLEKVIDGFNALTLQNYVNRVYQHADQHPTP